jgi:hypothetical protein
MINQTKESLAEADEQNLSYLVEYNNRLSQGIHRKLWQDIKEKLLVRSSSQPLECGPDACFFWVISRHQRPKEAPYRDHE